MADQFFGISDIGKKRTNNEDHFIAQKLEDQNLILACAIDGVGGYEGGEVAAQIAHDVIIQHLNKPFSNPVPAIRKSLDLANTAIFEEKIKTGINPKMSCVLSLALADIANNKFYYGHVGDTRLYLLRDNTLVKISHDHSFVGFLEDSGKLSEYEAMHHSKRNEISKALGFANQINAEEYIETGESPFLPGDLLLLCTDGLTDLVENAKMTAILTSDKDLQTKANALIAAANEAGGKDNITVVLVHNNSASSKTDTIKPLPGIISKKGQTTIEVDNKKKEEVIPLPSVAPKKIRSIWRIRKIIFFTSIVILAGLIYWVFSNKGSTNKTAQIQDVSVSVRNQQENMLLDSISHSASGLVEIRQQPANMPIIISDSIVVTNKQLHLYGKGATLLADSLYHGAAFVISDQCRQLVLDSITLKNFDIGIIANRKTLVLKNVQFIDCRIPVQYQFLFKDQTKVNGTFSDSLIFHAEDSKP